MAKTRGLAEQPSTASDGNRLRWSAETAAAHRKGKEWPSQASKLSTHTTLEIFKVSHIQRRLGYTGTVNSVREGEASLYELASPRGRRLCATSRAQTRIKTKDNKRIKHSVSSHLMHLTHAPCCSTTRLMAATNTSPPKPLSLPTVQWRFCESSGVSQREKMPILFHQFVSLRKEPARARSASFSSPQL